MAEKTKIDLDHRTILVTGAAGFIGAGLIRRLLEETAGSTVVGLDNMNSYYDVGLKRYRLDQIREAEQGGTSSFHFLEADIGDGDAVKGCFDAYKPTVVVNLAAQAGVRYSITNPDTYIHANLIGFYHILECCRHSLEAEGDGVEHLVYASSSSVYGGNQKIPFEETDFVDHPVSLYAATKKADELLAHSYGKLFALPSTGLRFFTVYGPAGRPDMAYFSFTERLRHGEKIQIFNYGNCKRDFTYVDDIVEGIVKVMKGAPKRSTGADGLPAAPCSIYNIGNSSPENLMDFVSVLSEELVRAGVLPASFDLQSHEELVPMQAGDVPVTFADTSRLERDYDFRPGTDLRTGLRRFAEWYKDYYRL